MKRVKLNLRRRTNSGVSVFAKDVKNGLTNNADVFASSPITPVQLANIISEYDVAAQDALLGGKPERAMRDTKRKTLEDALKTIANYVENVAQGDVNVIYLAGMEPQRAVVNRYLTLATPHDLRATSTLSGKATLNWQGVAGARNYEVEFSLDPVSPDAWMKANNTAGSKAIVTGLTRTKDYWFRVRALGTEGVVSNWSDSAKVVVV